MKKNRLIWSFAFAALLAERGASEIVLAHLSRENNRPEVAYDTVCRYLAERHIRVGEDLELTPLERLSPSVVYELLAPAGRD